MVVYNPLFHLVYCKKYPKDIVDMGCGEHVKLYKLLNLR